MNQAPSETEVQAASRESEDPTIGYRLTIVAGDNQTAFLLMTEHGFPMATFDPVAAELRDADGAVLAGEPVAWSVGETPGNMGIQLDPMGTSPLVVLTDERGVATLDKMRGKALSAFYDYGVFPLIARHGAASVTANLTVAQPPTLKATIVSGDNQSVARSGDAAAGGTAVFAPIRIVVRDPEGNPAPGIPVNFEAVQPKTMTIQISSEGSSADITTDAEGVATLDLMDGHSMICRGAEGEFKVVVTPKGTKPVVSHHTVSSSEDLAPVAAPHDA